MQSKPMVQRKLILPPRWETLLIFLLVATLGAPREVEAARGRPSIADGTLVTDTGTLLRGPRVSLDRDNPPPTLAQLQGMKDRGANSLHVYAERKGPGAAGGDDGSNPTPGYKLAELQELVDNTRALDMYLVMTIGNSPPSFNHTFTVDFWDFYAEKFGHEPHVIFEIQNEPFANFCPVRRSQPSPIEVLEMERDAYCAIRNHSTDSTVLFFSYAMFSLGNEVLNDIANLEAMIADPIDGCGRTIDWSQDGIAAHGYDFPTLENTMQIVSNAGYGVVFTEFGPYCRETNCAGQPIEECYGCPDTNSCSFGDLFVEELEIFEETEMSWLNFMLPHVYLQDPDFKDKVDAANLIWIADSGVWPASSNPPFGTTVSLFSPTGATFVSADQTVDPNTPPLRANTTAVGPNEKFDVVDQGDGTVALKARANAKFVDPAANLHLEASSSAPVPFEWFDRPNGRITLRPVDGKFVAADFAISTEGPLVADRAKGGGTLEAFDATQVCPVSLHDQDYCQLCGPCQEGESNCEADVECASGLVCAHNVGANYGLPPTHNVCEQPSNIPPVAGSDAFSTGFETALVFLNTDLLSNDDDPDSVIAPTWVTPQSLIANHGQITTQILFGGAIEITYTPDNGFVGTDGFSYLIEDDDNLQATGQVSIEVLPIPNSPPVANADSLSTPLDTTLTFTSIDLTQNDTDPDQGDTIVFVSPQTLTAVQGNIQLLSSTFPYTYQYTPPAGFEGNDSFTYSITDNHGLAATNLGQVTIQVAQQAPVAQDDHFLVPQQVSSFSILEADLVANDQDPNGDPLSLTGFGPPAHGLLTLNQFGLTYTPFPSFWTVGSDSFTYDVSDGLFTDQGVVHLTAEPVCGSYLADGFETGDLSAWSQTATVGGGSITADSIAAGEGSFGLLVAPAAGTSQLFVEDDSPVRERNFRAAFLFNPNGFSMVAGEEHSLLSGLVPGKNAFVVRLVGGPNGPQLRLVASKDNHVQVLAPTFELDNGPWYSVFVDWWAASAPGANDGGARLWVDGRLAGEILGVDNDGRWVDSIRLGAPWSLDPGFSGTYFVDSYRSCDGPSSRQTIQLDDFESGDLAAWDAVKATGGGTTTVAANAALANSQGLEITVVEGAGQVHVREDLTSPVDDLSLEFLFDPNSIAMSEGNAHPIFHVGTPSGGALSITLLQQTGDYRLRIQGIQDNGQAVLSTSQVLSDEPHSLWLEFHKASSSNSNDGSLKLWVDGNLEHTLTGLDNSTKSPNALRLGAIWQLDPGTVGTLYFDDFQAWQ